MARLGQALVPGQVAPTAGEGLVDVREAHAGAAAAEGGAEGLGVARQGTLLLGRGLLREGRRRGHQHQGAPLAQAIHHLAHVRHHLVRPGRLVGPGIALAEGHDDDAGGMAVGQLVLEGALQARAVAHVDATPGHGQGAALLHQVPFQLVREPVEPLGPVVLAHEQDLVAAFPAGLGSGHGCQVGGQRPRGGQEQDKCAHARGSWSGTEYCLYISSDPWHQRCRGPFVGSPPCHASPSSSPASP